MTDIVDRLLDTTDRDRIDDAIHEITALRAEVERLREAIKCAIRQHEEGNKGLAHRTLCEAVYGPQA